LKQYDSANERAHLLWIRAYILFSEKRHPREMEEIEVERFLGNEDTHCFAALAARLDRIGTVGRAITRGCTVS